MAVLDFEKVEGLQVVYVRALSQILYMVFAAFVIVALFGKVYVKLRDMERSGGLGRRDVFRYLVFCVGLGAVLAFGFRLFSWLLSLFGI